MCCCCQSCRVSDVNGCVGWCRCGACVSTTAQWQYSSGPCLVACACILCVCIARAVSMPAPPACNAAVQLPIIPTAPSPARCPTCCHVVQAIQFIIAEAVNAPGPGEHIHPELAVRLPTLQVHRILSTELVVVQPGGQLLQQHRGQAHFLEVWDNILCRRLLQGMQPAWGE